jgi:hypothetical protein
VQVIRRFGLAASLAALWLGAAAATAPASQTIGQLAPGTPSVSCVGAQFDHLQPTVTSGTTYVVPAMPPATILEISSWSHNAAAGPGQTLTMKVYRHVAGMQYAVQGRDGPRALTPATINTFQTGVKVFPGDVLGFHTPTSPGTACNFSTTPADTHLVRNGDLADGIPGDFMTGSNRINISAVVAPSNDLTLGKLKRKAKIGTATLAVQVPNPGTVTLTGAGIRAAVAQATAAGEVKLRIRAKGAKQRRLARKGNVKLKATIAYTPAGGEPATAQRKLKLVDR